MDTLILGALLVSELALTVIDLILVEKKSLIETLITLQFLSPKKPLGIIGNTLVFVSAILLVLAKLGIV